MPAVLWATIALAVTAVHGLVIVPRLREPDDGASLGKVLYAALPSRGRFGGLMTTTLTVQFAIWLAPGPERWIWLVYGSAGTALIWVDACTTWLPSSLSWLVSCELLVAIGVSLTLADTPVRLAWRLGAGAGVATLLWWFIWWASRGGIGFGDVRLAPLVGAMAGTMGPSAWFTALLAGTVLGVAWGLVVGRRHPAPGTTNGFAYGPALWAGPYVALLGTALTG